MKKTSLFLSAAVLLTMAACDKPPCSDDNLCSSYNPPKANEITCEMYVEGFYYNSKTGSCEFYQGSGCSAPPFQTLQQCQSCLCSE